LDDGVAGGGGVLAGVLILGALTATDLTASEAEAEVDPGVAHVQALLTPASRRGDILDLVQM
jgi:hypothetical protein